LGQIARDEAKRGGQPPSIPLEAELAASMQESMAEQQKMIDQLSSQEAQAKAAQRQALRTQALQTQAQAQAIDPKAVAQAARAGVIGQVATAVGSPLATIGASGLSEQVDFRTKAESYQRLTDPVSEGGFGFTTGERSDLLNSMGQTTPRYPR
jgi:regulator of protease activity HflC (stomatin/prohibitin superfamily)